ncbi:hypothetical protein DRQ50_13525 [bacterium]|nr:MAG: hypothetical protein DRQ50_13525 [bacterium]
MAFRFGLEKVLRYRRRLVDMRSRDVAAAAARVAELDLAITDRRTEQERSAERGAAAFAVHERLRCAAWITRLEENIAELVMNRNEAVAALSAARSDLQLAWREREVLEQLRLRRREQWQLEMARRERMDLDEIGQQRALARQRQHSGRYRAELAGGAGTATGKISEASAN